jgi:hypothetical protein
VVGVAVGLVGASLGGAELVGALLGGAELVGASLDGAELVGASLDGVVLVWLIDPFSPEVELDGRLEVVVFGEMFAGGSAASVVPLLMSTWGNLEPTGGLMGPSFEFVELSVFL